MPPARQRAPDTCPRPNAEREGVTAAHDSYAALRFPNYRWFIGSTFTTTLGAQLQGTVVAWQIYAITRDPLSLGLIGLAEALPFISVALFAGHVADRANRRRIAIGALATLLACSLALLAITVRVTPGRTAVWGMYAVIVVSGVARSFLQPARTALGAELIPREHYPNAVAWRSSTSQLASVVGPALGGVLYGFAGAAASYAVDAALMGGSLLCMTAILHAPRRAAVPEGVSVRESLSAGVRFIAGQPVILGALTLDLFSVFFGGAVALLPVFADQILHVGPQGLGALRAAPAVGAIATSLLLAHRHPLRRAGPTLLVAVALFGLTMIGFGLSRNVALSVAFLAASGMVDTVSVVIRGTLLQLLTPEHLLGRVSAVNSVFIGSSNEIGAFESGVAAKLLGTVPSVVLGGLATLAVVAITAVRVPELRRLRELR
jgi:MFS family permease